MSGRMWLAAALAAIDFHPPGNPRFAQMPFRMHEPMAWRGRQGKHNPKRKIQAAAKRSRKITRRNRK